MTPIYPSPQPHPCLGCGKSIPDTVRWCPRCWKLRSRIVKGLELRLVYIPLGAIGGFAGPTLVKMVLA